METITKTTSNQNAVIESSPNWYTHNKILAAKSQGSSQKKGWKDFKSQRIRKCALRLCFRICQEPNPQSHQHDCFNMIWTKTTTTDIPKWTGQGCQPYSKNYRQQQNTENRRHSLLQERTHQLVILHKIVLKTYLSTSKIIYTELIFINLGIYMYICKCM